MLQNFSFVIDGELAGCARPGMWGDLDGDLRQARQRGIAALVSLTESPLPAERIRKAGLLYKHLPIPDFEPPHLDQVAEFVAFARQVMTSGDGGVLVHCHAGVGRTGTMLACFLVSTGFTADEAINAVRKQRPGSIETAEQEDAVAAWEQRIRGRA